MPLLEYFSSILKDLTPLEVFDYYDGPKFYSCRDKLGQLFVVYWIDESDTDTSWLYLRVSQERYASLKQGYISIAEALSNPEEGRAFVVKQSINGSSVCEVTVEEMDAEWFPSPSDYLNLPEQTLPSKFSEAAQLSQSSSRHVIDLAFEKASNVCEMGCGKLGKILDSFQNLIYALACDDSNILIRKVPEGVKFNNEVLVTGLFASSFGIRMQSKGGELFEDGDSAKAFNSLAELIEKIQEPEQLAIDLHRHNILARSRFKNLIRVIIEAQVSLKTDWGRPTGGGKRTSASINDMIRALSKLDELDDATKQTVERSGNLVGVDVNSDFFVLVIDGEDVIKGKLSTSISNSHFEVPSRIRATIEETCVIDPLTEREKWTYLLLDFTEEEV